MGKDWDRALPSLEIWKQCFRVLKEGKLAFIMCSPRQDVLSRMIINLETAGFRTNYTSIYWTYASGFPKAANLKNGSYVGFQPKPAVEIILVVSKDKTLTWLDDCRIPFNKETDEQPRIRQDKKFFGHGDNNVYSKGIGNVQNVDYFNQKGRFPANLLVSDDVLNDGKITKSSPVGYKIGKTNLTTSDGWNQNKMTNLETRTSPTDSGSYSRYFSLESWSKTFPFLITPKASKSEKNKGCEDLEKKPKLNINKYTAVKCANCGLYLVGGWGDCCKCDKKIPINEKHSNFHPTVKPLKLFSYLITMGSREGDLILDPFCGSGTACIAAHLLHRKWIGIEINGDYMEIIKERLKAEVKQLFLEVFL